MPPSNRLDPILAAASGLPIGSEVPAAPAKGPGRGVPGRLVNVSELADLTGYDRDTIAGWIDRKGLPSEHSGSVSVC